MKIGIITAMSSEHEQLAKQLRQPQAEKCGAYVFTLGTLDNGNEVILMQCGIGKVNAAIGATLLIEYFSPQCVISTGVAGGIDSAVDVMEVVASAQTVHHDVWCGEGNDYGQVQGLPTFFQGDKTLLHVATNLNGNTRIHSGLICSGDQFITDRTELNAIKTQFPQGLAVDMESASIAQVCYIHQIPFLSFRIISDTPGAERHWEQYTNFWGEMANRSFQVTKEFLAALPVSL